MVSKDIYFKTANFKFQISKMNVLIIKNVASEGPGTIEDFLKESEMPYSILDFYDCKAEVPDLRAHSHLIVMGGPMAVYDVDEHAFLSMELAMIRTFIRIKKPVLGICLGAQMIAYALGAEVYRGEKSEIGWDKVDITPEGMNDPLLSTIAVNNEPYAEVFQWHGDTFDLPKDSVRLSSSPVYKNQAFRYKDNVYGLQFHVEVTPGIIREWFAQEQGDTIDEMFRQSDKIYPEYHERAKKFYEKFFS
jgi:GMP synthase-like glutamine amidotransferase